MERRLNISAIESAMESKGLSAADLARALDVSRQIISQWLKGRSVPRPDKRLKLALTLELGVKDMLLPEGPETTPVIAFRKKRSAKTTTEHIERAITIGRQLRPLVPHLPFDQVRGPRTLKGEIPIADYDYLQNVAREIRKAANLGETETIDFHHLIRLFADQQAALVPVLWGTKKNHENALHIHLPDSQTTWVFLNLDVEIHDFKFWMTHELAHVWAPSLRGDDAEEFADAVAACVLFPEPLAAEAYPAIRSAANDGARINTIKAIAEDQLISPITVYMEANRYARRYGEPALTLEPAIYGAAQNLTNRYYTVSGHLFDGDTPTPEHYIQIAEELFDSPFFRALKEYLKAEEKGPGYVQSILQIPLLDARALHAALT